MLNRIINLLLNRWFIAVLAVMLFLTACASSTETPEDIALPPLGSTPITVISQDDVFSDIPAEARIATRQGDPRPVAYWALWNTCAPENRAGVAAANGGREAGFMLLDDLLADPGIQLGNYPVTNCEEGLALLRGRTTKGDETNDPLYELASALLAAELNLDAGAESCPIAEEAVVGGHLVLSQVGFNGDGVYVTITSSEVANSIPRLVELLLGYNRGELCR